LVEDFCRSTGLDQITVEELFRAGRLQGALVREHDRTRPFGIFDDELPSREALVTIGLPVRDDYDPNALRSHELADDDPDDA
jgi:hypothetical protein